MGPENHKKVEKYITTIRRCRKVSGIFIIGDMNFPKTNWEDLVSTDPTEQLFLNTFGNLSLEQLVDVPTHAKGNILDYLITDSAHLVKNLTVEPHRPICGSDHHPIKFDLSLNTLRTKPIKRTIYNFKHADWDSLNSEFLNTNWEIILTNGNVENKWKNLSQHSLKFVTNIYLKLKYLMGFNLPGMTLKYLNSIEKRRECMLNIKIW